MAKERACRTCHLITTKAFCPKCKTQTLSDDFSGAVIILDPKNSIIAKRLNFDVPGKYALRVR
ncbi:MAG: transcription elongation factor subunit Spt4 [Promethearchaeota archaeon]